jgi:hypothetical protein
LAFSVETVGRLLASARGYAQFGVGALTSIGLLSAANSKGLAAGLSEVFTGISQTIHGFTSIWTILVVVLAPITSMVLAKWSSHTAKTSSQAAAVQAAVIDPNTPISPAVKTVIVSTANEVSKP